MTHSSMSALLWIVSAKSEEQSLHKQTTSRAPSARKMSRKEGALASAAASTSAILSGNGRACRRLDKLVELGRVRIEVKKKIEPETFY